MRRRLASGGACIRHRALLKSAVVHATQTHLDPSGRSRALALTCRRLCSLDRTLGGVGSASSTVPLRAPLRAPLHAAPAEVNSGAASPPPPPPRRFGDQRLRGWLARAVAEHGFVKPSPIQRAAMPLVAHHADVVIHAATGSGKTLAYLAPLLSRIEPRQPLQLLVLVPTRELALQVAELAQKLAVAGAKDCGGVRPPDVLLIAGGLAPPGESGALQQHRELTQRVAAGGAQVVVATPKPLLKMSRLGYRGAGGVGALLLLELAKKLDAIVLDEVDMLLPKPVVKGADFYTRLDYSRASKEERTRLLLRGSDASVLLRRLRRAARVVHERSQQQRRERKPPRAAALHAHSRPTWARAGGAAGTPEPPRSRRGYFQVVAASATVNSGLPGALRNLLDLPKTPTLVSAPHETVAPRVGKGEGIARGAGRVTMPRTVHHLCVEVEEGLQAKAAAVAASLVRLRPRTALLVLAQDTPLAEWLGHLRAGGVPQARLLHEAMGFAVRDDANRGAAAAAAALVGASKRALRSYHEFLSSTRAAAADGKSNRVLVTTERACRGLDLPNLDAVLLLHAPLTSDEYVHLAGRCGRGAAAAREGVVLSVLTHGESRQLGLFSSQLAAPIRRWDPTDENDAPPTIRFQASVDVE